MNRRSYLKNMALLSGGLALSPSLGKVLTTLGKKKTILLCTGIQYSNIGDIGHVAGILNLLNIYLPEAKIILWTRINVQEYNKLILKNFPDVRIIHSELTDTDGEEKPDNESIYQVAELADFVIGGHGMVSHTQWAVENYGKPYGIFGVSVGRPPTGRYKDLIDDASFFFTRETSSLENLKKANVRCKIIDFAPDATFGCNIEDDQKASAFMNKQGLAYKKYICIVPRLRVTPYYNIDPILRYDPTPWSEERIREVDELNNKHKEKDHAKVREAMITWIRETGNMVLVCPEMTYEVDIMDELLIDPLPDDVKRYVLKRGYWMPDEASTVYKNAVAVISCECHSPILSSVQGTPAFYLRQPEDGIKGQMWYDLGLKDWVFEIEQTTGKEITDRLMEVYDDYKKARIYLESAMDYVRKMQYKSMSQIRKRIL